MQTHRLYFDDPTRLRFEARVLKVSPVADASWVELDQTAFYPEGGGQPADHGFLDGRPVTDVQDREGVIVHLVQGTPPEVSSTVVAEIEEARRWDHTQQHSGQHLLSRLLVSRFGLQTLAFHLGRDQSSIDVGYPLGSSSGQSGLSGPCALNDVSEFGAEQIEAIEADARRIIRAGLPVCAVTLSDPAEIARLDKAPKVTGDVRVVVIEGVDKNPCGGTHVGNTAELEVLRIRRVTRAREGVARIEFLAGGRAHADHRRLLTQERALVQTIGAPEGEVVEGARNLRDRLKEAERRVRELADRSMAHRVDGWLERAPRREGVALIVERILPESKDEPGRLGVLLASRGPVLAVLVSIGEKARALTVASGVPAVRADQLLRSLLESFGGRGGGSAAIAEGSFPRQDDAPQLEEWAKALLESTVSEHPFLPSAEEERGDMGPRTARGPERGGGDPSASPESH